MPEEMQLAQPELLPDGCNFGDEVWKVPERGVARPLGAAGSELVVEDHGAVVTQGAELAHRTAASTRSAVDKQQGRARPAANDVIPYPPARNGEHTLSGRERCGVRRTGATTRRRRAQQGKREHHDCIELLHCLLTSTGLAGWTSGSRMYDASGENAARQYLKKNLDILL